MTGATATTLHLSVPPIIRAQRLGKRYRSEREDEVTALQEVSFDIGQGEFVSLVGPSGCGKSTLLKILAGLLPSTTGNVTLAERELCGPDADVGVVFQAPVLLPWRTVLQNVLLPIEFRRLRVSDYQHRAMALLATVGLSEFVNRYPHELSGGMQQRASIVRALIQDPQILLMDEPFGALDAMTREQMNLEVLRIWRDSRKTVVFVTHSITESVFLSDRVFVMKPRPGTIAEIVNIDLPRPRDLGIVNTERFGTYAAHIRSLLHAKEDLAG